MTFFGWVLVVLFSLMTYQSERGGRVLALLLLIGTLTIGTGTGL